MSGHSKWANIKHKKEKTDAQRGKIFTKIGREIAVAVKEGGGSDPEVNSRLKDVIAKAKANNVPGDNIDRVIHKAASSDSENYESITYEGYGPSGVAVIVETATDNRNRTGSDLRHYFDKFGGNLGTTGCVSYMFERKGIILIEKTDAIEEDELMEAALEAGAKDIIIHEDSFEIQTTTEDFNAVNEELKKIGYDFVEDDIEYIPSMEVTPQEQDIKNLKKMIELLEENDDVQNVYTNWDMPDELE